MFAAFSFVYAGGGSPEKAWCVVTKPLIGINTDFRSETGSRPACSFLVAGYFRSIIQAGGVPIIIPPQDEHEDLERILDTIDGCVLCGGGDLDPRNDGYHLHPTMNYLLDTCREASDRMLADLIIERKMPCLAIGCGMQLMNVALGGTLMLDVASENPRALRHFDPNDRGNRHALVIEKDSVLDRVYGDSEVRINSLHHQAVDDLAPSLIAAAYSPDGILEAFESRSPSWFLLGTQFHPESDTASALDLRIFEEFIVSLGGGVLQMAVA